LGLETETMKLEIENSTNLLIDIDSKHRHSLPDETIELSGFLEGSINDTFPFFHSARE